MATQLESLNRLPIRYVRPGIAPRLKSAVDMGFTPTRSPTGPTVDQSVAQSLIGSQPYLRTIFIGELVTYLDMLIRCQRDGVRQERSCMPRPEESPSRVAVLVCDATNWVNIPMFVGIVYSLD